MWLNILNTASHQQKKILMRYILLTRLANIFIDCIHSVFLRIQERKKKTSYSVGDSLHRRAVLKGNLTESVKRKDCTLVYTCIQHSSSAVRIPFHDSCKSIFQYIKRTGPKHNTGKPTADAEWKVIHCVCVCERERENVCTHTWCM